MANWSTYRQDLNPEALPIVVAGPVFSMLSVAEYEETPLSAAPVRPSTSLAVRKRLVPLEPPPLTPPDESAESSLDTLSLETPPEPPLEPAPRVLRGEFELHEARPMSVYARLYSGVGHRNPRCACCRAKTGVGPPVDWGKLQEQLAHAQPSPRRHSVGVLTVRWRK